MEYSYSQDVTKGVGIDILELFIKKMELAGMQLLLLHGRGNLEFRFSSHLCQL